MPGLNHKAIDIELIALCLSKNVEAQRKLYEALMPSLAAICKRYLYDKSYLKDTLQETFVRIFKSLDQFDVQKASFKTWSCKIAINCCLKQNEKIRSKPTYELISEFNEPNISPEVLELLDNEQLLLWLKKMPIRLYEVFNLYAIEGYSHKEIGNMLAIDSSLSRKRLSRARDWLKKSLTSEKKSSFKFGLN